MSKQKQYTATEMRAYADAIAGDLADNDPGGVEYFYDDLIPVVEALRQAADAMEREEREKKYEYIVEHNTMYGWRKLGFCTYDSIEDAELFIGLGKARQWQIPIRIMKREVGKWEEVK